jgi:hypothetical protein
VPQTLNLLRRHEVLLLSFSQRSAENARRAAQSLKRYQNSRKAQLGGLAGLQDPAVMDHKRAEEEAFRRAAAARPDTAAACDGAFKTIDKSLQSWASLRDDYDLLETGQAFDCTLFSIARGIVRLAAETAKPNADRLREYRQSNLETIERQLLSPSPIYLDLQTAMLADSLCLCLERKGYDDPLARKVMAGKSPPQRAEELVQGTKLADIAVRRRLIEGGQAAINASDDPMLRLALLVDGPARAVRTRFEREVEEPQRSAYGKLADIRFALFGTESYPDATGTLRLAFGTVKGYEENGQGVPAWTTIAGLYRRAAEHGFTEPFALPQSWLDHKASLDPHTPLNFVSTPDIIGGNSGSPVVNRDGELVGIIFDGNLPSLVWNYVYTSDKGRAVAVHCSAIIEALQKVYNAGPLVDELTKRP